MLRKSILWGESWPFRAKSDNYGTCPIIFSLSKKSDNYGTCPEIGQLRIGQLRYIYCNCTFSGWRPLAGRCQKWLAIIGQQLYHSLKPNWSWPAVLEPRKEAHSAYKLAAHRVKVHYRTRLSVTCQLLQFNVRNRGFHQINTVSSFHNTLCLPVVTEQFSALATNQEKLDNLRKEKLVTLRNILCKNLRISGTGLLEQLVKFRVLTYGQYSKLKNSLGKDLLHRVYCRKKLDYSNKFL